MNLLERYVGQYVQFTMDPTSSPFNLTAEELKRDGPFCHVGKLAAVDEVFALLSMAETFRPKASLPGGGRIYLKDIVQHLREQEARQAPNVADFVRQEDELPEGFDPAYGAEGIRRQVAAILRPGERLVPLRSIIDVQVYRE